MDKNIHILPDAELNVSVIIFHVSFFIFHVSESVCLFSKICFSLRAIFNNKRVSSILKFGALARFALLLFDTDIIYICLIKLIKEKIKETGNKRK